MSVYWDCTAVMRRLAVWTLTRASDVFARTAILEMVLSAMVRMVSLLD